MDAQLSNLQGVVDLSPTWRSMVQLVRAYMRDYGPLNILLGGNEETDDKTILMCIQLAVLDINGTPPPTSYSLDNMLAKGYHSLLLYGTMVHILEGLMLLETRNRLTWNEGGHMIAIQDKTPMLDAHVKYYRDLYSVNLKQKKISDSITTAMDPGLFGVHSEYLAINGYLWGTRA